ncbi:MAG: hypothetical protein V3S98_10595 [Dehalococcoidia bacterium]
MIETPTKIEEKELPDYVHADLPQCHNPALNFYAVYLEDWDGTQTAGAVPCIETWSDRPFILEHDDRYMDPGIDHATTVRETSLMEGKRFKIHRNRRNKALKRHSRGWQHILYRSRTFYEDQDVAAATKKPFVRAISLFCPAWRHLGDGRQERHGIYEGLDSEIANHPSYRGKAGFCPSCGTDPKEQAKAVQEIVELYRFGQKDLPDKLADLARKTQLTEGLV